MQNQLSILRDILDQPGQELDLKTILEEIELLRQLGVKSAGFFSEIIRRLDSIPIDSVDQPSLLIH